VVPLNTRRNLSERRLITVTLPEFVICALQAKVAAANRDIGVPAQATIDDYLESELVNLITVRDVAVLEEQFPGFTGAVNAWLRESCG